MQCEMVEVVSRVEFLHASDTTFAPVPERGCRCDYPSFACIPVNDLRGRYCAACGHFEFHCAEEDLSVAV